MGSQPPAQCVGKRHLIDACSIRMQFKRDRCSTQCGTCGICNDYVTYPWQKHWPCPRLWPPPHHKISTSHSCPQLLSSFIARLPSEESLHKLFMLSWH